MIFFRRRRGAQTATARRTSRRIIGVGGLKGGSGKSTIATALAIYSAVCGYKTYLVDLDYGNPASSSGVLGARAKPGKSILDELLGRGKAAPVEKRVFVNFDDDTTVEGRVRVYTPLVEKEEIWRQLSHAFSSLDEGEKAERISDLLARITSDSAVYIVDLPPLGENLVRSAVYSGAAAHIESLVWVTVESSVDDVRHAATILLLRARLRYLVVNMYNGRVKPGDVEAALARSGMDRVPVLLTVRYDPAFAHALSEGIPPASLVWSDTYTIDLVCVASRVGVVPDTCIVREKVGQPCRCQWKKPGEEC